MRILHSLLNELKAEFSNSRKGEERGLWFVYTIVAIIVPFTSSKTSNLLRGLKFLFGFTGVSKRRYYTFMASTKLPWQRLWPRLWKMIPNPLTDGRLLVALDDSINPKTGKKIFGCHTFFDHAAKKNQSSYPWAHNIVAIGLLKIVKKRWAFLPLSFRLYHPKKDLQQNKLMMGKKMIQFKSKLEQSVDMLVDIAQVFVEPILIATDSWFGNNGLWRPLRKKLGSKVHLLSRLRTNNNLFALPDISELKPVGRPPKYGEKIGNASSLALLNKDSGSEYEVNLYGKTRTVTAYDQIVMLKTLKCKIRVVWVYRKTTWIALFSTDLTLTVEQIIEFYGARWKIESGFKELKQEIGSAETQTRNPFAVTNHLQFCMMASTVSWIYASRLEQIPARRHFVRGRKHFAFSDVRRLIAEVVLDNNFDMLFPVPRKSIINSLVHTLWRLAA